jgi:hypothetical protein
VNRKHTRVTLRRGAVVVWTAVSAVTLLGFAALSIDLGYIYMVCGQLQNAADAAAMGGATAFFSDLALKNDTYSVRSLAISRAQRISLANFTANRATTCETADIVLGRHDFNSPQSPLSFTGRMNAVNVTERRTVGSSNGPLNLFFANIFGISQTGIVTRARAAVDDRYAGYRFQEDGVILPFSIFRNTYNSMLVTGGDLYSFDGTSVNHQSDGIREIKLYPWKDDADAGGDAAGNFGTLNIGVGNQGTQELEAQIINGATAEQMRTEFGTPDLIFCDSQGQPNTYTATGNPGLSVGLRDAVEQRIGDVVGFFIHDSLSMNGTSATYVISGIRFGRVMDIHIVGNPKHRTLVIQPVAYTSGAIMVDSGAPSSNGYVGRAILVQ